MKKFKTLLTLLFLIGLSIGAVNAQTWNIGSPNAAAVTATISGSGDNLTLTISGTGAMRDFSNNTMYLPPWYDIKNNIKTLIINAGVTTIGNYAFWQCTNLTGTLTIPNTVTSIGNYAFRFCYSLTGTLTISNSVTTIGNYAFDGCNFTAINVDANNQYYSSQDGILYNKLQDIFVHIPASITGAVTIPNTITSIPNEAFVYRSSLTSITIPNSVTSIGDNAFYSCSGLTSVTIPNSVTSIGMSAFSSCSDLTTVNFNATNCTTMGDLSFRVFLNCTNFTTLNIGENVTRIPATAFSSCNSLTSVTIPNSVTTIEYYAFYSCSSLTSLTIGNSVTTIEYYAFEGCSGLTSVTIGNSVTSIGSAAFSNCSSLTSVTIPNSVTSIEDGVFVYCSGLTSVTIPNSITTIGYSAFHSCSSLTSLTIPNSVTSIGYQAFYSCSSLTSLTIGNSVTIINEKAFEGCSGLDVINILKSAPPVATLYSSSFTDVPNHIPVNVPCGMKTYYENSLIWSNAFNNFQDILSSNTITVQSSDNTMGSASVMQLPLCTDPQAIIEAIANNGYCFMQWNDDITENPRTVSVTSDTAFIAIFSAIPSITVQSNDDTMGNASVTQNPTCTSNQAEIEATGNSGYCFTQWNDGNTENPRIIAVTNDTVLTAIFTAIPNITVESNNNIMGSASVTQQPTCTNPEAEIEATANIGYRFVKWGDDDTQNPRTVTVTQDITFTAIFESESGIENIKDNKLAIQVFPNPTTGELRIEIVGQISNDVSGITIFDIYGKTLMFFSTTETVIDISHLSAGVYFVRISTEAGEVVRKVLKE